MKRKLSLMCITMLLASSTMIGFADTTTTDRPDRPDRPTTEKGTGTNGRVPGAPNEGGTERPKPTNEDGTEIERPARGTDFEERQQKREQMGKQRENKAQEKDIKKQLKELGDGSENAELRGTLEKRLNGLKEESKQIRTELKQKVRKQYSSEELEAMEELKTELEGEGMEVMEVDNILSDSADFKFDAPPVIKEGRTLIPVRAISEGFDAEVSWDGEEKKVTITKDGIVIELWLGNNTATADGLDVVLDSNPEIIRGRTFVPLRFIAETLVLKVAWDSEDGTIELLTDEEEATEEATEEVTEEETTEEEATEEEATEEEATEEEAVTEEDTTTDEDATEETPAEEAAEDEATEETPAEDTAEDTTEDTTTDETATE